MDNDFWRHKTLAQMNQDEWEAVCDGCGQCCLHKLEDDESGQVFYTSVACKLLNVDSARCSDYSNRKKRVPDCLQLKPDDVESFNWLPSSCAYRLLADEEPLPQWHPLVSGSPYTVSQAGYSVAGRVESEVGIKPDDMEDKIIYWVE